MVWSKSLTRSLCMLFDTCYLHLSQMSCLSNKSFFCIGKEALSLSLSLYLWVMRRAYKTPSHLPLVLHHKHFFHYIITKTQKFYFCFSYNFRVTSSSLFSYSHCQKHEVGFSDQRTKNLRLLRKKWISPPCFSLSSPEVSSFTFSGV